MNKKILPLIIVVALVSISFVQLPTAQSDSLITIFEVLNDAYNLEFQDTHPSDSAYYSAIGNVFIAQNTAYLAVVNVEFAKFSSPTSNLYCWLAPTTGDSSGTTDTGRPDGITVSQLSQNSIAASSVAASKTYYTFIFNQTYQLVQNQQYAIYVTATGGTMDTTNKIQTCGRAIDTNCTWVGFKNGAWEQPGGYGDYSMTMQVYGVATTANPTPAPTATPTASPTPEPPDLSWGIWAAITPYADLLLSLFIVMIIAVICYKFGGVWGFFAGLNVGYVLCVVFDFLPLWGMVALLVVDGLLLFGKVGTDRSGG